MDRKLATARVIRDIQPIEGADNIELCFVDGWQSVVKKNEFVEGELVIFAEIDSILPDKEWSHFLKDKNRPDKPIRVKTCKLKGTLSQGIIFPLTILDGVLPTLENIVEGQDYADVLGIVKYEPKIHASLMGKVLNAFPTHIVPKTDSERLQNLWNDKFKESIHGTMFAARFKEDGTSFTVFHKSEINDATQVTNGVCSRNLQIDPSDEGNVYVEMAKKYDLLNLLKNTGLNLAIQAEIVGPGIQKNTSGVTEKTIRVFDVYDIDAQRYYDYDRLVEFCKQYNLPQVETLTDIFVFDKNKHDWEYFIKMTEQVYPLSKKQIEGLVFTPIKETYSPSLRGRLRFKVINPAYLLNNE
jgi:RNA ligase (TIGR02306 family)